jgi:hypothetical protein
MLRALIFALLIFAVLIVGVVGCHKGPRGPRFAIELPPTVATPASRVVVDEGLGSDSEIPLASLTPEGRGKESLAGWEKLGLHYTADGNGVKVTLFALHQEYDARRHSTIFKSQRLGAQSVGLGGSARLTDLEKYGYSPLTLRVVPAK